MKLFIACVWLLLTVGAQSTSPAISHLGLSSSKIDQDHQLINSIFGVQFSTSKAPYPTSLSAPICPPAIVGEPSTTTGGTTEIEVTSTMTEEIPTTDIEVTSATDVQIPTIDARTLPIFDSEGINDTILDKIASNIENTTILYDIDSNSTLDETIDESIEECHFMSFEEWKKQKQHHAKNQSDVADTNFTTAEDIPNNDTEVVPPQNELVSFDSTVISNATLAKESGKTYKNKFNFASVDCAATVVKTNSQAKGASSILTENKDSYLLNECASENKFVIIELCQDILVENVVIGNFEFFSSMFKNIKISVSDRFPAPQGWKLLGEFEALNIRDVQTFTIENPLIWARYLKLEILSHYGSEFYCPLSIVRVHGKTMMDELKEQGQNEEPELLDSKEPTAETTSTTNTANNNTLNFHLIDLETDDECKVVLPHLRLAQFLNNLNSSQICNANELAQASVPSTSSIQLKSAITTQESIYKNIIKRLSLLESNASLSLLYIEEQSKLLSTAFSNLEKRQSKKFEKLITNFNSTLSNQLLYFRDSYSIIQKDTVNYFSTHENLIKTYNQRIAHISNDLKFQKKLSIFNSFIIICILAYVIITRDAYVDMEYYENDPAPKKIPRLFPVGNKNSRKKNLKKNPFFKSKKKQTK